MTPILKRFEEKVSGRSNRRVLKVFHEHDIRGYNSTVLYLTESQISELESYGFKISRWYHTPNFLISWA